MVFVAENVLPKIVFVAESLLPKIVFVAANLLPKMLLFADRPLPSLQSAVMLKLLLLEPTAEKASEGMAGEMLRRNQKNWNSRVSAVAQLTTPLPRVSDSLQYSPFCSTVRNEGVSVGEQGDSAVIRRMPRASPWRTATPPAVPALQARGDA